MGGGGSCHPIRRTSNADTTATGLATTGASTVHEQTPKGAKIESAGSNIISDWSTTDMCTGSTAAGSGPTTTAVRACEFRTCARAARVRANGADTATEMWQWRSGAAAGTQQGDGSREEGTQQRHSGADRLVTSSADRANAAAWQRPRMRKDTIGGCEPDTGWTRSPSERAGRTRSATVSQTLDRQTPDGSCPTATAFRECESRSCIQRRWQTVAEKQGRVYRQHGYSREDVEACWWQRRSGAAMSIRYWPRL